MKIDELRALLKAYDDGHVTEHEVGALLIGKIVEPHVQLAVKGVSGGWGTSYCGSGGPTLRCIIEIGPGKPAWFKPLPEDHTSLEEALAALKFYRSIPGIPPGPGGSTVPFMKAIGEFERMADKILGREPDPEAKIWGVYAYWMHADSVTPPGEMPPGGFKAEDLTWTLWQGTKREASVKARELDAPLRRSLGYSCQAVPLPGRDDLDTNEAGASFPLPTANDSWPWGVRVSGFHTDRLTPNGPGIWLGTKAEAEARVARWNDPQFDPIQTVKTEREVRVVPEDMR